MSQTSSAKEYSCYHINAVVNCIVLPPGGGGSAKVGQRSFGSNFLIYAAWRSDHRHRMRLNSWAS